MTKVNLVLNEQALTNNTSILAELKINHDWMVTVYEAHPNQSNWVLVLAHSKQELVSTAQVIE